MKPYHNESIPFSDVQMEGAKNVKMKILIGSAQGSKNIVMRYFSVGANGNTPKHSHDFEHVVKFEKNKGIFVDEQGTEHEVCQGMSVFVAPNTVHQFKNPYNEAFDFLCIIPNPDKNDCCPK